MPLPDTVALIDPVDIVLLAPTTLSTPTSALNTPDTLPSRPIGDRTAGLPGSCDTVA
jgi:hypothetical protein